MKRIVLLIVLFFSKNAFTQTITYDPEGTRPKIGVVLSGGGAKGFAHIGFLKVLEEVGIRPDYITGTSMGSIVGGLYALGYSAQELEEMATDVKWDLLLSNDINLRSVNIIEKENFNTHFLQFQYRDGSFKFPRGLIKGQELSIFLARLACSAHFIEDFDEFPIPFRCVAVDVLNGDLMVFEDGYLADAQRASMAIPAIFEPVKLDGKLLVDGGVIRNFPVQEALDMGADVVIGAYTGGGDVEAESLGTAFDFVVQTSFLYSIADSKEQRELCNYYVNLSSKYTAADFDKVPEIIADGERIARLNMEELKSLAEVLKQYPSVAPKNKLPYPDSLLISKISIDNVDERMQGLMWRLLNLEENKYYDIEEIEGGINHVYGTQFFNQVHYSFSTDSIGITTLHVDAYKNSPATLSFGIHYNRADDAALILKGDIRNAYGKASILQGGLRISKSPAATASLKQYIGSNRRFLYKFGGTFQKSDQSFFLQKGELTRTYDHLNLNALGQLLWQPHNDYLLGLGYEWNNRNAKPIEEEPLDFKKMRNTGRAVKLFFKLNTLNENSFPTGGNLIQLALSHHHGVSNKNDFNSDEAADFLDISLPTSFVSSNLFFSNYNTLKEKVTIYQHLGIGLTSQPSFFDNYLLGGDFFYRERSMPFVGLKEYQAPFSNVANLQVGFRFEVFEKFYLGLKGNVANGNYDFNSFLENINETTIYGGGLTISCGSILGPLVFTVGRNSWDNSFQYEVNLGHRFVY